MRRVVVIALLIAACGPSLTPVEPPSKPGGSLAVPFTREFEPGHWAVGRHAYRLALACPRLDALIEPSVVRFDVDPAGPLIEDRVWLRFDGPSTSPMSPTNLAAINPDQATGAVMTLVGLSPTDARLAVTDCTATVVYDGNNPEELAAGEPFTP